TSTVRAEDRELPRWYASTGVSAVTYVHVQSRLTRYGRCLYFRGMHVRRDATLNLSSLLHHSPGSDIEVEEEGLLEPTEDLLQDDGLSLAGPLEWSVRVFNTGGDDDFVVDGSVAGVAVLDCRRCLTRCKVE